MSWRHITWADRVRLPNPLWGYVPTRIREWLYRRQRIRQARADTARRRELRLEWEAKNTADFGPEFEDAWDVHVNTPLVPVATLNERWLKAHPERRGQRRIVCRGSIGRSA